MKTREPSKCREWEKVRRDKLNQSFAALSKVLPNHDPLVTLSKIDILQHATAYIEELQQKLKDVLTSDGVKKTERDEIKALYERIKKLLLRNEQLSNLLKDAGIRIPSEYGTVKNFKRALRWSNKITAEQAKEFAKKELQKENKKETGKLSKKPKHKNALKKNTLIAAKHQKRDIKKAPRKVMLPNKKSAIINLQLSNIVPIPAQQGLPKVSSQPCFIITNTSSVALPPSCRVNKAAPTVVTNSSSLAAPKMAAVIKPPASKALPKTNTNLSSLGPGTLILANGSIVPILPPPTTVLPAPTVLANPAPILLKPPCNNTALIVMPTKTSKEAVTSSVSTPKSDKTSPTHALKKTFTTIRAKRRIPRPMHANKLPIPALTSRYSNLLVTAEKSNMGIVNQKKAEMAEKLVGLKKPPRNQDAKVRKVSKRKLQNPSDSLTSKHFKTDSDVVKTIVGPDSSGIKCDKAINQQDQIRTKDVTLESRKDVEKVLDSGVVDNSAKTDLENSELDLQVPLQTLENSIGESANVSTAPSQSNESSEACKNINEGGKSEQCLSQCKNEEDVKSTTECISGNLSIGVESHVDKHNDETDVSTNDTSCEDKTIKTSNTEKCSASSVESSDAQTQPPEMQISKSKSHTSAALDHRTKCIETKSDTDKIQTIPTTSDYHISNHTSSTEENEPGIDNNAIKEKVASQVSCDGEATKTNLPDTRNSDSSAHADIQDKNLELGMNLNHSELSNDIFSSLQVPIGGQNPESTSPTAAFLLAFPLVSSLTGVKVTEVIEEENSDSRHGTPTLLQIGTMDSTKTTQSIHAESLTPNLLNLDSFSFFSGKDMCNNFYSSFDGCSTNSVYPVTSVQVLDNSKSSVGCGKQGEVVNPSKPLKVVCEPQIQPKMQNLPSSKESMPLCTPVSKSHVVQNVPATSDSSVLYTSSAQAASKSNLVAVQSNVVRQMTSVSYSKLATVSSSYVHGTSATSTHVHYDSRQKNPNATSASTCKDMNVVSYSTSNTKNSDSVLSTAQYNTATSNAVSVAQCNAFNPFSDFSKPSNVHSYATFSKPYGDPLYTSGTHYNYAHHNENNFEQNMYYPAKGASSKASTTAYGSSSYTEPSYNIDCKNNDKKHDLVNPRHNSVNYYNQTKAQTKEKFPAHSSKGTKTPSNQPKPPINWMTTPDFRSQPTNVEYLVPPPFGKDIEYNPNSFYSSNSFAATTHTSYFNATSTMYTPEFQNSISDNRKSFDSLPIISTASTQRSDFEENQFSWSPTKLPQFLETPHSFVSSTLPTLVGDLALGTTQPPFAEQKSDQTREHVMKSKESSRRSKVQPINYDSQSNFLSVSQLVENKSDLGSSRTANRKNSGTRNVKNALQKGNKHSHKPTESKGLAEGGGQAFNPKLDTVIDKGSGLKQNPSQNANTNYAMQGVAENSNWMVDCSKSNRHGHKNPQSSYSAEALIGHQDQSESTLPKQRYRQQQANYNTTNKALPIPTFLSDNIVPYFAPVEIPQDNNFMQANPNYQGGSLTHSFTTSSQNNAYPSATYISTGATITSSYLQPSSLIPEFGSHDFASAISENAPVDKVIDTKHCGRNENMKSATNNSRTDSRPSAPQQMNVDCSANSSNNFLKKSKHKHSNEGSLPGLVDFGFLSMPSTINSPILPDDFHTHSNFLPPPTPSQLYPCKNSLYPKQSSDLNSGSLLPLPPVPVSRSGAQHFENSAAATNAGSSLTSFNLSAIFPEINKGPMPLSGLYSESTRNKNYNFQRNYLPSSVQVSFGNKSTSSSSYINSVATNYASAN